MSEKTKEIADRIREKLKEPGARERVVAMIEDICDCGGSIKHNEHAPGCPEDPMTYFRAKPGPTISTPPDPSWDNAEDFKSMRMEETTNVNDPDRFDLSRLTDAHVRALLGPHRCDSGDLDEATRAGLLHPEWGVGFDGPSEPHTVDGRRALTEAQRIANEWDIRDLQRIDEWDKAKAPRAIDAVTLDCAMHHDLATFTGATPLFRLVLALHERRNLEREAGSRLPDSDAACERWESEKDER